MLKFILEEPERPPILDEVLTHAEAMLAKIDPGMAQQVCPAGRRRKADWVMFESAAIMRVYVECVQALSYDIGDLNFILYGTEQGEDTVATAMARIDRHVEAVLWRHRKLRALRCDPLGVEGRDILVAIHGHLLGELRVWLESIISTLRDPIAALEKRGEIVAPGVVKLPIGATFSTPPQFDDLEEWAERCRGARSP